MTLDQSCLSIQKYINTLMQFLKNMGSAMKPSNNQPKNNYFSSLNLATDKQPTAKKSIGDSNSNKKSGPPKGFIPQKFALDFDPPCIILEYRDGETDKLYHHKMKIVKLKRDTSSKEALDYLKKKHYHYFMPKIIDEAQVEKLIQKLKSGLVGKNQSHIEDVSEEQDFDFDYDDDFENE